MDNFVNNDKCYWNKFYKDIHAEIKPNTLFAEFIMQKYVNNRMTLLDCGCGNGRDSLYFASNGLHVTGVDISTTAIKNICNTKQNCRFVCTDFINSSEIYSYKYDICYSRFSLHTITLSQELLLHQNVYNSLNINGLFCIEVRSIHDELYGKGVQVDNDAYIFNEHYRRFLNIDELIGRLINTGFTIKYAEENIGFAPFNDCDPEIIRIVAKKAEARGI